MNLIFIVVVNHPVSLTKPILSSIFLTQKVFTTNHDEVTNESTIKDDEVTNESTIKDNEVTNESTIKDNEVSNESTRQT
jgi:hypothetical protein